MIDKANQGFFSQTGVGTRPSIVTAGEQERFLVFLGCSFTYGIGVKDEETIPSLTQKKLNKARSYNYGIPGASPYDMLFLLQKMKRDDFKEGKGRIVYTMIHDHLVRFFWEPSFAGRWGINNLMYEDRNGELQPIGTFKSLYPFRTAMYQLLLQSELYNFLGRMKLPDYSDEDLKRFSEFVGRMNREAQRITGQSLIIILYPGTRHLSLQELLRAQGAIVLDYNSLDLARLTGGRHQIPGDGHPTPEANAVISEHLAKDFLSLP